MLLHLSIFGVVVAAGPILSLVGRAAESCSTPSGNGACLNTVGGCESGSFVPGWCPGDETVQCCVIDAPDGEEFKPYGKEYGPEEPDFASPSTPDVGSDSIALPASGQGIVDAAVSQEGKPYVWGGGGCNGPTSGGFDCSGLTQYAVCQARNQKTIPRTAGAQYHSSMGKHIPRSQAEPGDMIFWSTKDSCDSNSIKHVGIFMREGWMVNAAKTGTPVREQAIWISSGSLSICPDAVRF